MPARVALLSHRHGNIGHDFMAVGMEAIVRAAFGSETSITHFEQHRPFDVYPAGHLLRERVRGQGGRWPVRQLKRLVNLPLASRLVWTGSQVLDFDLAVACGGPNLIPRPYDSADLGLMFHHLTGAFARQGVPVVDAAVGACFPLERIPDQLQDPRTIAFYRRLFANCAATSVRDRLAQRLWQGIGREASLIPCGAIATGRAFPSANGDGDLIAINYLERGANEDWGQGVDAAAWRAVVRELVERLQRRHKVVFLCHDAREQEACRRIGADAPTMLPASAAEYGALLGRVAAGLACRIHAAVPMAGMGIPSVGIGTDSRLGTLELLGLRTYYVKQASAAELEHQVEDMLSHRQRERDRLIGLREDAISRYVELFRRHARLNT